MADGAIPLVAVPADDPARPMIDAEPVPRAAPTPTVIAPDGRVIVPPTGSAQEPPSAGPQPDDSSHRSGGGGS
jgi:hypothetical protein